MTTPTPCDHDKRFTGVFDLPKGTNGCLACAYEKALSDLAAAQEARQRAEADAAAVRELMNVYNLGGWTDAVGPMKRAQAAEALAESYRKDAERWQYWRSHPENWNWSSSASLYVWKSPTKLDQDTDRLIAAIAGEPS